MRVGFGTSVRVLCLLIGAGSSVPPATAQAPRAATMVSRADAYLKASVRHDQFSGTVLIAKDGVPVMHRGYGMANYELQVPNSPRSVFLIGSLSKQFTAVAILQLRDRGRLTLTDPICKYLDRCPEAWKPVTLRHLLTHTSGIFNISSLPEWDDSLSMRRFDRVDFLDVVRERPLLFAPGAEYKYSNTGYYLLGLVIDRVSGTSYEEYLHRNIFAPLGMTSTRVDDGRTLVPNRTTGYYWAANSFVHALPQNVLLSLGSGGILSTTGDLLRWDAALYTDTILSRSSRDEMFTPVLKEYGYGWEIRTTHGRPSLTHSGSQAGFSAYFMRLPTERVTVIVLSNSDRTSAGKVANALAAIYFGVPYRMPEAQLFDILGSTIAMKGVAASVHQYRELKRSQPEKYDYGEEMLNDLGYDLLLAGKSADALAVFTLMVEMFPGSSNAYDSLGEAYMALGEKALSIKNYERSLQLDPENVNAVGRLAKLRRGP